MKWYLVAVCPLITTVLTAAVAEESAPSPTCGDRGLLLTISVSEGLQKVGGPITTTNDIRLPNNITYGTSEDAETKMPVIGSGMFIICQTERGDFIKFKGYYARVDGLGTILKAKQELQPYTLDMAKCFDLPAGRYEVQLLFTRLHSGFLDGASNRITITVK
jgi:hypothetical protein